MINIKLLDLILVDEVTALAFYPEQLRDMLRKIMDNPEEKTGYVVLADYLEGDIDEPELARACRWIGSRQHVKIHLTSKDSRGEMLPYDHAARKHKTRWVLTTQDGLPQGDVIVIYTIGSMKPNRITLAAVFADLANSLWILGNMVLPNSSNTDTKGASDGNRI